MKAMSHGGTDRLFHTYLLSRARELAGDIAITSAHGTLTYGEVAMLAENYAAVLDEHGLRAGDVVIVELSPRPEAIPLLAALASRAITFVCVSPESPQARKENICFRVGARAHITSSPERGMIGCLPGQLNDRGQLVITASVVPLIDPRAPSEQDLAYVAFTSGSTGEPKGISMTHRAVVSFWRGAAQVGVTSRVRLGSMAPLQFDFSILDVGMALGAGGTLVQLSSLLSHHPASFVRALERYEIQQMNGVPSIWQNLLVSEELDCLSELPLDTVLYAGEGFSAGGLLKLRVASPAIRLINCFGHSESIACCFNSLGAEVADSSGRVPFGTAAIEGMSLYLVDSSGALVTRPGQIGEIYIEGDALCSGYWQDLAGTAAAFVPSPISGSSVRAFRTRDLGYRDVSGQHYFYSRADTQVKVLGNRIELEEVDVHLRSYPGMIAAATVFVDQADEPRLVSFVQCEVESESGLRGHCTGFLPRSMVPSAFVFVREWPLTPNGKIDRAELLLRAGGA